MCESKVMTADSKQTSTQTDERMTYKYLQWKALPSDKTFLKLKRSFSQLRYCDCVCHQVTRNLTATDVPGTRQLYQTPKYTESEPKRTNGRPPMLPRLDDSVTKQNTQMFQRSKSFVIDGKVKNRSSLLVDPDCNNGVSYTRRAMKTLGSQYVGLALSPGRKKCSPNTESDNIEYPGTFLECNGTKIDGSLDSRDRSFESDEEFDAAVRAITECNAIQIKEKQHSGYDSRTFKIWKMLPKGKTKKTNIQLHKLNEEVSLRLDYKNNYQAMGKDKDIIISDIEEVNIPETKPQPVEIPQRKAMLTVHVPTLPVIHPSMLKQWRPMVSLPRVTEETVPQVTDTPPRVNQKIPLPQITETDITISRAMALLEQTCPPTPVAPPSSPSGPRQRPRRASHGDVKVNGCV